MVTDLYIKPQTDIVNLSFSTGTFPDKLKHAIISPVIKKQNLDANELKNFRPVSNIHYLSRLLRDMLLTTFPDTWRRMNLVSHSNRRISLCIAQKRPC